MSRLTLWIVAVLIAGPMLAHAQPASLTVKQIMQDPKTWIGASPSQPWWSEDGTTLYFRWNPKGQFPADSLYKVDPKGGDPVKLAPAERRRAEKSPRFDGWHHGEHVYDRDLRRKVYAREGDIFLYDRKKHAAERLTHTRARETDPHFTPDDRHLVFAREDALYRMDLASGAVIQLTDLRSGSEPKDKKPDAQDAFLEEQQKALFEIVRKHEHDREQRKEARERDRAADNPPPVFYVGKKNIGQLQRDPRGRFVTFTLSKQAPPKRTRVANYVTESGYEEDLTARAKVGAPGGTSKLYVQDLRRDSTYKVDLYQLPGAYDVVPVHLRDEGVKPDSSKHTRSLFAYGPFWNGDGSLAVVEVRTRDNKDRWIARLHPESAKLTVLDRQTDEAWLAGPGISWFGGGSTMGWLPDGRHFYFQSERSGYSHLYTVDVESGTINQLTDGAFEVFDPQISRDGKTWFFTSSEGSPFERHFYRMPLDGGQRTRLTSMTGNNAVALSPDERRMAVRFSFTNRPPEIFIQTPGKHARRITHSTTAEWEAYPWRTPEITTIKASDGVDVPAQIFEPEHPNGAAVLFVHGAGYLQNVHRWWSGYFREYMFHNLLADKGYLVVQVDYRASAGYGRDWRTAIYRHMGGRDLGDYTDASRYLQRERHIDADRIFIYGGSYGGFMTLMALFTDPQDFGGGAALRSVTDWAHYNHTYTANILNTPVTDSLAYARSSPIYFADGLEDPLLIAHGMVDTNVHFQDVVRLAQRFIELGKKGWELAVFPVESHGFVEPTSWTDEYSRILKYIETTVGPKAPASSRE